MHNRRWIILLCCVLLCGQRMARGEDEIETLRTQIQAIGALKPEGTVVAKVAGDPVDVVEVNQLLRQSLRERAVEKDSLPTLEAHALEQVINKRLVSKYLDAQKIVVTPAEIEEAYQRTANSMKSQGVDIADYIAQRNMSQQDYREQLAWDLRWSKFLAGYMTDERLEKFFDEHRAEYDGTEVRVSQILLRPSGAMDDEKSKVLTERAEQIRQEIAKQQVSFADAAQRYSDAPSGRRGGDVGLIARRGLMHETFSAAAFQLKVGEISPPFTTQFGVHILLCTEIKPGTKTWSEVRKDFESAAVQDAFLKIAMAQRASIDVQFTGAIPYIKPDTGEVVFPGATDGAKTAAPADAVPKTP